MVIDVKKVADMARFATHVAEFRYHVQDAYYREGFQQQYGEYPLFVFIAVSESIDCERYPVRVFQLSEDDVAAGYDQFRRDLRAYHACREADNWGGIEEITRPEWAKRNVSVFHWSSLLQYVRRLLKWEDGWRTR